MRTISTEKLNEKFGTGEQGEEIGYGERGVNFREVECDDYIDFAENAEIGQCWTDESGETFYKIRLENDDVEVFMLNEDGKIEVM